MEWFVYVRAVMVGAIWGGTVYLMLAFIFMFFPLPTYFYVYTGLRRFAANVQRRSPSQGIAWFERRVVLMRALAWLLWLSIVGLYAWSFQPVLAYYIIPNHPDFWRFYAAGIALPSLWLLRRAWLAMRRSDEKTKTAENSAVFAQQRPLLDRIAAGERVDLGGK